MELLIKPLLAAALTFACLGAWYILQKHVQAGLVLVLGVFVTRAIVINHIPVEFAGINFYPEDLVFTLLAAVAIPRLLFQRRSWTQIAFAGFAVLVVVGFILGTVDNTLKLSGVECRPFYYFSACALYFLTFSLTRTNIAKLAWLWNIAAIFLIALAGYRWVAQFADFLPVPSTWANTPQITTLRVLAANEALFLWQTFLLNLYLRISSPAARIRFYIGLILPPLVMLLQHRSVWAVVLASGAIVMVREGVLPRRVMLVGLIVIVVAGIFVMLPTGDFSDSFRASLDRSLREPLDPTESTFSWRVEGWKQLLDKSFLSTGSEIVFGRHFGRGLIRYFHGEAVNVSSHNFYMDAFMQLGVVGLCVLVFCYLSTLARLRHMTGNSPIQNQFLASLRVMLATDLVYFIVYSANYEQGIILGAAIGLAAAAVRSPQYSAVRFAPAIPSGPRLVPKKLGA